ncbi:MAG: hypothetical protein QM756_06585 [Polyangiaceae bacterium]
MNKLLAKCCVLVGSFMALAACGPLDSPEAGDVANADEVMDLSQAATDLVPGLTVSAPYLFPGRSARQYSGICETRWRDSTHAIQSLCQIQRYWGSGWHDDAVGWTELNHVGNYINNYAPRSCAAGADYTVRVVAKGRVLFSSGWSPYEQAIGPAVRLICPTAPTPYP